MPKKDLIIFTDGSCSGNGSSDAIGGIGIHFPNKELKDVSKIFKLGTCTNQRTELYAILTAIRYVKKKLGLRKYEILIKTDSDYSINCITKWVNGWIKNGWKTQKGTDVANREFIEPIYNYCTKYDITFEHVDAHTGLDDDDSIANDKADKLATRATAKARKTSCVDKTEVVIVGKKTSSKKDISSKKISSKKDISDKKTASSKTASSKTPRIRKLDKIPRNGNFIVELVKK